MVSTFSLLAAGLLIGQTGEPPVVSPPPGAKVYVFNNGLLTPAGETPKPGLFGRKDVVVADPSDAPKPGLFGRKDTVVAEPSEPPKQGFLFRRDGTEPNRPILNKIQGWFKRDRGPATSTEPPLGVPPAPAPVAPAPSPNDLPKKLPNTPTIKDQATLGPPKAVEPAVTPASLKQGPISGKTPILAANANRIGRDDKFAWITGQLEIEAGGKYVLYYATPETVDTYHGRITLVAQQVNMQTFQSGDLISVHGHLASRGGSTTYHLIDANLIERPKR